jgi:hypothetical protein
VTKSWAPFLLAVAACLTLGCGDGGSSRQLQSMTIDAAADCCETILTATGTYNTAPSMVTPLPTSWSIGTPPSTYQLTTQPYTVICGPLSSSVVTAMSPVNPNAPSSGLVSGAKMIVTTFEPCNAAAGSESQSTPIAGRSD